MPYLHHTLLHFPIALGVLAPLFAAIAWMRPKGPWLVAAQWASYFAAASAMAAIVTGLFAAPHVIEAGMEAGAVQLHRNFGLGAGALLLIAAGGAWLAARHEGSRASTVAALASVAAAAIVAVTAHLGGEMLHPGLAPWSGVKHSHKQMNMSATSGHADHDDEDDEDDEHSHHPPMNMMDGMADMATDAAAPVRPTDDAGVLADAKTSPGPSGAGASPVPPPRVAPTAPAPAPTAAPLAPTTTVPPAPTTTAARPPTMRMARGEKM